MTTCAREKQKKLSSSEGRMDKKVLIGIPTRGQIHYAVVQFLTKQVSKGYSVIYLVEHLSVESARLRLFNYFKDHKEFSHLFFNDDVPQSV